MELIIGKCETNVPDVASCRDDSLQGMRMLCCLFSGSLAMSVWAERTQCNFYATEHPSITKHYVIYVREYRSSMNQHTVLWVHVHLTYASAVHVPVLVSCCCR